jgi:hypothetical protein
MSIVYGKMTNVIATELYDFIKDKIAKNENKYKAHLANFFNKNHNIMYDIGPYDIIYYTKSDSNNLFNSLGITEKQVSDILKGCYWYGKDINPPCVKEPYVEVIMVIIIYFLKHKKQKEAEISIIYLAFSGKFYASLFAKWFPIPPSKYRSTMDYVINNMLNDKFDLKTTGSVFGAIRKLSITTLETYKNEILNDCEDEDIKYFVQQLRDRESAFLYKIAKLYYNAFENKYYLNYESDNVTDADEFRITDSDATIAARITENAVNFMLVNNVDLSICNEFKDANLRPTELRDIIEAIVSDKHNINQMYRVCNILICDFMRNNHGVRVDNIAFIEYSLKEKPNSKDKYIIELQEIIMSWLDENSPNYRRRKSRKATAIAYRKAVKYYFIRIISKVAGKSS